MDRRRSPPRGGMDRGRPGYYGGGGGGGGGGGMERRRSRSPPYRRSPPAHRRHRRDAEPQFDRYREDFGRGPRSSPRYDDYPEERRPGSPERSHMQGPMSFKQFLMNQEDDPSPEEAQQRYQAYLVDFHGSEIKAEFAQNRNDERVRAAFDPRMFEKVLAKRNEEALESALRFAEDFSAGQYDPASSGFNQGAGDLAPKPAAETTEGGEGEKKDDAPAPIFAPSACWLTSRVASDTVLARRLMRKLDWEKGFTVTNPLLPPKPEQPTQAEAEAQAADAQDAAAAKEEGKEGPTGTARRYVEIEDEPPTMDSANFEEAVGKLDVLLAYLWKVHGVDYYSGYELTAAEFPQRLTACRLLRGPKPEEGEAGASTGSEGEAAEAAAGTPAAAAAPGASAGAAPAATPAKESRDGELAELKSVVDEGWSKRLIEGDPLEARCMRKKVEELLDKWIEDQIICHADNKWGSHLSNKLFVARKFVVKHIRTKHEEKLQAEKERILDDLYFENFKAFKEEEARAAAEAQKQASSQEGMEVDGGAGAGAAPPSGFRGGRGGRFGMVARGGRFAMGRGRGGRGMAAGMVNPGMMMGMDMMSMGMPMGPMGPMIMPSGAAPFMPMSIMPGMHMPFMPGMMMGAAGARGRGGRGMRGGRGGRFGMMGPGAKLDAAGVREYYDLDNPQNNRAVLDYGDL